MSSFECLGSNKCGQYCKALGARGVVTSGVDNNCGVPSMFSVNSNEVVFAPPTEGGEAPSNPELVEKLGESLLAVLSEHEQSSPDQEKVKLLAEKYNQLFEARNTLWQAMIGATREHRPFTDTELEFYQDAITTAKQALHETASTCSQEIAIQTQAAFDHHTLMEYSLVFDDQIIDTINRLVGNLTDSKSTLIVGNKGIAKTQIAKFVAKLWEPSEAPTIISGHGDMMSNEFIGGMEQDETTGQFIFKHYELVRAMKEGRPVIYDEVNVSDQAVAMRLQDILLLRPGQPFKLQENGGETIIVQPGFMVIATANEASKRYTHRHTLDQAFRDRFDVREVTYPDSGNNKPLQDIPSTLLRLALAAAVDERGVPSRHIDLSTLEKLVRLAHVTQHLYSVPARDARTSGIHGGQTTSTYLDNEPIMTDCITPRTMIDAILRCVPGNKPDSTLAGEIESLIRRLDQAGSTHNQELARQTLGLLEG